MLAGDGLLLGRSRDLADETNRLVDAAQNLSQASGSGFGEMTFTGRPVSYSVIVA